jgi:hypothetical protein
VSEVAICEAAAQVVATTRVGAAVSGTTKCTSPEGFPEKDPIPTLVDSAVEPHGKTVKLQS